MSNSDFAEAKAYLQTDRNGANLYNHISEVLLKLVTERPNDSLEIFEHISSVAQRSSFNAGRGIGKATDGEAKEKADAKKKTWVDTSAKLYPTEEDSESTAVTEIVCGLQHARNAGVGLSPTEAYRLEQSMTKLAIHEELGSGISSIRYWGKIFGTSNDYYILESNGEEGGEDSKEEESSGPNYKSYWASNTIGEPSSWTKLPNVTSQQVAVVVSGNLKRFFTGDLNAQVQGHPVFPGNEAAFLHATIAVIDSQTALAPSGKYTADNEDDLNAVTEESEYEPESTDIDLSNVVLIRAGIGGKGRVKTWVENGEDGEPLDNEYNNSNPSEDTPALRSLDEEEWSASNGALKSKKWPGFTAFTSNGMKSVTNIYVGHGISTSKTSHTPLFPLGIPTEYDDSNIKEETDNTDAPVVENEDAEDEE